MFNDEPEMITDDRFDRCDGCKFYLFVDSGYGYCRRFPPKEYPRRIRTFWGWITKSAIHYQLVEWCRRACGEFKSHKS